MLRKKLLPASIYKNPSFAKNNANVQHHHGNKFVAAKWGQFACLEPSQDTFIIKEHDTQGSNLKKIMKGLPASGAVLDLFHNREHHEGHPHPFPGWTKGETALEQMLPADLVL